MVDLKTKEKQKVIVAMSPYNTSLHSAFTGQAGGIPKKKIIVAMSGGVDSSVAAALLKKQGFQVLGVHMRLWKEKKDDIAEKRAKRIARILGIPFFVLDLQKEFKKRVVKCFLEELKTGTTPNPCVVCNKEIKFGLLLEEALKMKADFIATGHYVQLSQQAQIYKLLKAKDKEKDQSYFLWELGQKELKNVLFPIGNYTKGEVKTLARKFKLPVLKARKSVEICFVKTSTNNFLKKYLKEKPDKIVDANGKILGKHSGLWFYTIGQRKGLGLAGGPAFAKASAYAKATADKSAGKPYYVLDKDPKRNLLIVTKNEKDLYKKELTCKNINWISGKTPKLPLKIKAKIRYRHNSASATIYKLKTKNYKLIFDRPQKAITPGQSVVFYQKNEVLGGGIICK